MFGSLLLKTLFRLGDFRGKGKLERVVLRFCRVVETRYGPLMRVRQGDFTNWASICGVYGDELSDLLNALPENSLFLDIGANAGIFTLIASHRLSEGFVVSIEPNPMIYRDLLENLEINQCANVLPIHAALALETGLDQLSFNAKHTGMATVGSGGGQVSRMILRLGAQSALPLWGAFEDRPIFCKIDTEGYETEVVRSLAAAGLLDKADALWIEINDSNLRKFGSHASELYGIMASHGFVSERGLGFPGGEGGQYDELFRQPAG